MEEHFILRVPPSVAERLNRVLNEDPALPSDNVLDLSFLVHVEVVEQEEDADDEGETEDAPAAATSQRNPDKTPVKRAATAPDQPMADDESAEDDDAMDEDEDNED